MNPEERPPDNPNDKGNPRGKLGWLLVAFLPGALGLFCMAIPGIIVMAWPLLILLNVVTSIMATDMLGRGIKNEVVQGCLGFFLFCTFFILNTVIVVSVGCSGSSRL